MKPKTIEITINTELKQVVKWLKLNKLSLNAGKTKLIIFHSQRKHMDYDSISIKLGRKKLKTVTHVKYLGMQIDDSLTWNYHIDELCRKLSRANGILSQVRYNVPLDILHTSYIWLQCMGSYD